MTAETVDLAGVFINDAFPDFSRRSKGFAYDWLGRIFAIDSIRTEGGLHSVLLFDPGAGEVLEIHSNLVSFHENELVDYSEESLAAGFYERWLAKGGLAPKQNQCIGYKRPLFLGGKDTAENLEI
jgi:hypothetical protein